MSHIVIIGNGIAGITTARHVRQQDSGARITVISAESSHFYSRTALMYIYMGHMTYEHTKPYEDGFWKKNRIDLIRARVDEVDTAKKKVWLDTGNVLDYDTLVLATGSVSSMFNWPGVNSTGVQGLYGLDDLARMEEHTRGISRAVVVGGGLIGIELVEMLHSRHIGVTMLVREPHYWSSVLPNQEGDLISRHVKSHGIDLRLNAELKEILPDDAGRVRAVTTTDGGEIAAQFVGLGIGVKPNVEFLKSSGIELGRGVLVNDYFETNVPDVYAIGDCNEFREPVTGSDGTLRKTNEQIWYTGRMHGETLAQTLGGKRTAYQPGVFFNSAKFFDIEYQTYGTMNAQLADGEQTHYWEHPNGKQCLRINYEAGSERVVGIHAFGLRLRHAVCERWIRERRPLSDVLTQFRQADFNPEFSESYVEQLTGAAPPRKNWLQRILS